MIITIKPYFLTFSLGHWKKKSKLNLQQAQKGNKEDYSRNKLNGE
jgi:hypothetical protein